MQPDSLLEFREEGPDLVTSPPRTLVSWRSAQGADGLPRGFFLVHKESAIGPRSATFRLRAVHALRLRGTIEIAVTVAPAAFKGEPLSLRAVVGVFRGFITKLVVRKIPIGVARSKLNKPG